MSAMKDLAERWPKLYWTQRRPGIFVGYERTGEAGRAHGQLGAEQITVERMGPKRWLARDLSGKRHKTAWGSTAEQAVDALEQAQGEGEVLWSWRVTKRALG